MNIRGFCQFLVTMVALISAITERAAQIGVFEDETEIGNPAHTGTTTVDPASGSYVIAGGGENMWFTNDSFHFVWKRISGDFDLHTAVEWLGAGGNPHRKACL